MFLGETAAGGIPESLSGKALKVAAPQLPK
jgi:hypothetical protein